MTDYGFYDEALAHLKVTLGRSDAKFRADQYEAIEALVRDRQRVLVVQRTGWGKSLVYFIATRMLRDRCAGPTLLISPLLSLMRNQIQMAENVGIRAATINSANTGSWGEVEAQLESDSVDLLLISPERMANDSFRQRMFSRLVDQIGLFVVDEVHCISDWGHDFRPDYRRIRQVRRYLPDHVPILGTTATANDRVIHDVQEQIGEDLFVLRGELKRESLRLQNITMPTQAARMAWLATHLKGMAGSGIVYCLTVRDTRNVAAWLQANGIDAEPYSADLDNEQRIELEQRLLRNEIKVLVATTALGMGFDKPDLGFVIHFQRPGSVIHYYQQIGRAGRALPEAHVVLLCGEEDETITDYFRESAFPPENHLDQVLEALESSDDGLTPGEIEQRVNLSHGGIERVLKRLATEDPAPIARRSNRWIRTEARYEHDRDRIDRITELRLAEQQEMRDYMECQSCLMAFLEAALGAKDPEPCGRCAPCLGGPILPETVSRELAAEAHQFLRKQSYLIEPRKRWAVPGVPEFGFTGTIASELRHEPGRSLSLWRDSGWGEMVYVGKFQRERFPQNLVRASARLIQEQWCPQPAPAWITGIPSLQRPELVSDFAIRLARELGIPYHPSLTKLHATAEQKTMQNSYQQLRNIAGSFAVSMMPMPGQAVLLVDDIVDSRWTFTVAAAELRQAGSGPVIPFALSTMLGS